MLVASSRSSAVIKNRDRSIAQRNGYVNDPQEIPG